MSCGMSCGNVLLFSIYVCVKNQNAKSVSTVLSLPYSLCLLLKLYIWSVPIMSILLFMVNVSTRFITVPDYLGTVKYHLADKQ